MGLIFRAMTTLGSYIALSGALSLLLLVMGVGVRWSEIGLRLAEWVLPAYFGGLLLSSIGEAGYRKPKALLNPLTLVFLSLCFFLLSIWDLLVILLAIPFVILDILVGPFMILIFCVTSVMLGVYAWENVLGFDIAGVSSFDNLSQAGIGLTACIISFLVMLYHFKREEGQWVLSMGADFSEYLRRGIRKAIDWHLGPTKKPAPKLQSEPTPAIEPSFGEEPAPGTPTAGKPSAGKDTAAEDTPQASTEAPPHGLLKL